VATYPDAHPNRRFAQASRPFPVGEPQAALR
jgi:hypothetical protein